MTRQLGVFAIAVVLVAPVPAAAQRPRPPEPTGSISRVVQNGKQDQQPVQIEATTLEVRDRSKTATFSGNVQVVQGDTTMKCQKLVVFYGAGDGAAKARSASRQAPRQQQKPAGMPQNAQNIRRIEARGGVTVVTKDQSASGDLGIYDLRTKTITLTGNVVVSQGKNVLHGDRVIVDTETGNARVESRASARNRVRALIMPGKSANGTPTNIMSFGPARTN